MKKNDIVYILRDNKITRTVIQSVRDTVLDGKKQPTEYEVSTNFAAMPSWVVADELYTTPEAVLEKVKSEAIQSIEEEYSEVGSIYDARYKGGIEPSDN
jgi:hypothetical protein